MRRRNSARFLLVSSLIPAGLSACGVEGENNLASLDTSKDKIQSVEEGVVGLVNTTGVAVDPNTSLQKLVRDTEHWEFYEGVQGSKPLLYIPNNLQVAMSAFRRAFFPESNQDCSGTLVHEQSPSGSYHIYYLTAHHCLYAVTPLGERSKAPASSLELQRFEIDPYYLPTDQTFKKIFSGFSGVVKQKIYAPVSAKESKTFTSAETYSSSDVIRIPYKMNVTAGEAFATSLPICSSVEPAANKSFGDGSTGLRLMLGYDKNDNRLVTERMNGKHNLAGVSTGEYRASSSFSAIHNYVFQSMMFGSGTSFYGYKTAFKAGAEQSDSGAPVLYGSQSPSSRTLQGTKFSFIGDSGKFASSWKVDSIDCVSGVISRILSKSLIRLSDARAGTGFAIDSTRLWDIGAETITVIQDITHNPSAWKKL